MVLKIVVELENKQKNDAFVINFIDMARNLNNRCNIEVHVSGFNTIPPKHLSYLCYEYLLW